MVIHVPFWAQSHFWDEPPADSIEFWATRFEPKCRPGDRIEFYFKHGRDGWRKVAEAVVDYIEIPGQSVCLHSGRYGNMWKVFWRQETFKDLGRKPQIKTVPIASGLAESRRAGTDYTD